MNNNSSQLINNQKLVVFAVAVSTLLTPSLALAADPETMARNLVTGFIRLMIAFGVFFVGKAVYALLDEQPGATKRAVITAAAFVALIGLDGIVIWLKSKAG